MITKHLTLFAAVICILLKSSLAYAKDDEITRKSNLCVKYFNYYERHHSLPNNILHSISEVETGKLHPTLKKKIVWPWTINVEGKGYHFDNKQDAVKAVKRFQDKGIKLIDVGCMQINLHHHGHHFGSLDQAFDPRANVEYGAKFLKSHYEKLKDWNKAVAHYHSANKEHGVPYANKVAHVWHKMKFAKPKISANVKIHKTAPAKPIITVHNENEKNSIPKKKSPPKHKSFQLVLSQQDLEIEKLRKKQIRDLIAH